MTADENTNEPDSERVVPPPPATPTQPGPSDPTVPLAPPLGQHPLPPAPGFGTPASPYPASPIPASPAPAPPAASPAPPYANPAYAQPAGVDANGYPLSTVAPPPAGPRSGGRSTAIVLGIVGAVLALAITGVAVAVGLFLNAPSPGPVALPTAVPGITDPPPSIPSPSSPSDDSDSPDDADPDSAAGDRIAAVLQAKADEYKRLRDSGALWQTIPDNEYNRTAVSAFLYFLTDMKVATIWGVDQTTATEYEERMAMLEERLLAQEPLGDDIQITLEEGRVFRYDGDTGEGGYSTE